VDAFSEVNPGATWFFKGEIKMKNAAMALTVFILMLLVLTTGLSGGENQWTDISDRIVTSGTDYTILDGIQFQENHGWIASRVYSEIYHTENGAETFELIDTPYGVQDIHMLSSTEGYIIASGPLGYLYRTINGGSDWTLVGSAGNYITQLGFPPGSRVGYVSGFGGKIFRVTDTGWSLMNSGVTNALHSVCFPVDTSEGWAGGGSAIIHYHDGAWSSDQNYPSGYYRKLFFVDYQNGWAVGDNGLVIHTNDGQNWSRQTNPAIGQKSLYDVHFLNQNEGWAVGVSGTIIHTQNGGNNWVQEARLLTSEWLWTVFAVDPQNVYAGGDRKTLLKYGYVSSIEPDPEKHPAGFQLAQNYPNPFNPHTTIRYSLGISGWVVLQVCDLDGHELQLPVNQWQTPGDYFIDFEAGDLPSGLYFYRLQVGQESALIRKMLLIR
jgi:photosystem II stability/assembly factor-like uncharacterized protein